MFFDGVRVPLANVLGTLHEGWTVAMAAMSYERGLFVLERQIRLGRRLADLASTLIADGRSAASAETIGRLHARLEMLRSQVYATVAGQDAGSLPAGSTSVDKLVLAEVYQDLFGSAFDLLADAPYPPEDAWAHDLIPLAINFLAAGTSTYCSIRRRGR